MDTVNPIMVGRNATVRAPQEQATQVPANPLQEQMAALAAQQAQQVQQAPQVSTQAPQQTVTLPQAPAAGAPVNLGTQVASVQQAGGCAMYFNVKAVTKIVLEMPWGFINSDLDCAFISNVGELVVCDLPPMYDSAHDVFVLDPTAYSLVLGSVAQEHAVHWRESVSFRPDSGYSEEDVKTIDTTVQESVVEEKVEEVPARLVDSTDYSHLSRNQRKRIKKKKLASGVALADLPQLLREA